MGMWIRSYSLWTTCRTKLYFYWSSEDFLCLIWRRFIGFTALSRNKAILSVRNRFPFRLGEPTVHLAMFSIQTLNVKGKHWCAQGYETVQYNMYSTELHIQFCQGIEILQLCNSNLHWIQIERTTFEDVIRIWSTRKCPQNTTLCRIKPL